MPSPAHTIIQISDCHLRKRPDDGPWNCTPDRSLQEVLAAVNLAQPDLIVLTGDLSDDGSTEAYTRLKRLVDATGIEAHYLLGNHDHAERAQNVLGAQCHSTPALLCLGDWRLIALNTTVAGHDHGTIDPDNMACIRQMLSAPLDHPVAIFLHHPPVLTGCAWLDEIGLANKDDFIRSIRERPELRAVFFGHIHQTFESPDSSPAMFGCPSTAAQFLPRSDCFALADSQPGWRQIKLHSDGRFSTQVMRLEKR